MTWPALAAFTLVTLAAAGGLVYYACSVPGSQLLGPTLVRGPARSKRVALTFDDGPAKPFTEEILDILRNYQVPATFFVCGKNVERFPEMIRRIQAEDHTIGNHTYSHPLLYFQGRAKIAEEIDRTQAAIERVTGQRPSLFRPPYGIRWFGLFSVLRERGMRLVQWSDTGFDWKRKHGPEEIARLVLRDLKGGSVILLHDGREPRPPYEVDARTTVRALPEIIEGAEKAGFEFVSVEEFLS